MEKYKLPIALSLVGIVLIIGGIITSSLNKSRQEFPKESLTPNEKLISVDVSGAVSQPGVYRVKDGARIEEAITAASGFSTNANSEYISKYLNMAQKLSDGTKIYVPFTGEEYSGGISSVVDAQAKVNINNATQKELESVNWIGPSTASKIIAGRPYQKIEELLDKKIVGKATFEKIRDSISVY